MSGGSKGSCPRVTGLMPLQGQSGLDIPGPCWGHGPLIPPKPGGELSCVLYVWSVSGRKRPGFQAHRGETASKPLPPSRARVPPQLGCSSWKRPPCLSSKWMLPPLPHLCPQTPHLCSPQPTWGDMGPKPAPLKAEESFLTKHL